MRTILCIFTLALAQSVLAQPVSLPVPRQHPALAEFDMSGLDAMRARVQAVINRPADLSPDKVVAFDKARRAAEAGDTAAQLDLAQMLHGGEGTPRDVDAGLAWMRKSAEGGYGPAQAFLGVAQSDKWALIWYERAGWSGDVLAMRRMLDVYVKGELGQQANAEDAAEWRVKLAEKEKQ